MVNAQKYKDELIEIMKTEDSFGLEKGTNKLLECSKMDCKDCFFYSITRGHDSCLEVKIDWLIADYMINVTEDEYNFLRLAGTGYLVNDRFNTIYYYKQKPDYDDSGILKWHGNGINVFTMFDNLNGCFQFIKPTDEAWSVEDLRKNCVIVKGEN